MVTLWVVAGCGRSSSTQPSRNTAADSTLDAPQSPSSTVIGDAAWAAQDAPFPESVEELDEEGQREADRLVELFPESPDAWEVRGRVYFLASRHDVAAACWQRCLELDPKYAYAHHGLGLVAARYGQHEETVAHQRKATQLMPGLSEAAHELADALLKVGHLDEAIQVLQDHLAARPDSTVTWLQLGQTCVAAQKYEQALAALQTFLNRYPDTPRAQFSLGTALMRLGRTEEAAEVMQQYQRARVEDNQAFDTYREETSELERRGVDYAVRFTYASRLYLAHGQLDEAERLLRRAGRLDPANTESRVLLAMLFQQTNRPESALEMCQTLVVIAPENPGYHLNLGVMYRNLGRFSEAEDAFQEVVRLAPDGAEGYAQLATLFLITVENLDRAVECARHAAELRPSAAHFALLGRALSAAGDREGAIAAAGKAAELEPANPRHRDLLQRLKAAEGHHALPSPR